MFKYVKAHCTNANIGTKSMYINEEFSNLYEEKLSGCNFSEVKQEQLKANLHESANRLFSENVAVINTNCTWWDGNVLYFDPSKINSDQITEEQRASFIVMHSKKEYCRIEIVLDLTSMTWSEALKLTYKASFSNLVDGLRLWSTIPHSIDKIKIISKDYSRIKIIIKTLLPLMLSPKLQKRIYVCSD